MHRDKRAIIVGMLRHPAASLTAPRLVARAGLGRTAIARQLAALEAEGSVGRIAGTPQAGIGAPTWTKHGRAGDKR